MVICTMIAVFPQEGNFPGLHPEAGISFWPLDQLHVEPMQGPAWIYRFLRSMSSSIYHTPDVVTAADSAPSND